MDRRELLKGVAAAGLTTAALPAAAAAAAGSTVTIYAQRAGLTLPELPVPGVTFCCKLKLFSDKALKTPIGTGSAMATVIEMDLSDPLAALGTPVVQSNLVLTGDGSPGPAVTLGALFRRSATYPRTYDAVALGGHGAWAPTSDMSKPAAMITAHGPGNGDYLTIVLRTG